MLNTLKLPLLVYYLTSFP